MCNFVLRFPVKRLCRKCSNVSLTLLGAAVWTRESCNEVNHRGSRADSHVIKATWNIRRRGRAEEEGAEMSRRAHEERALPYRAEKKKKALHDEGRRSENEQS